MKITLGNVVLFGMLVKVRVLLVDVIVLVLIILLSTELSVENVRAVDSEISFLKVPIVR